MAFMVPGGILLALALSQGVRLDWFNSPFITWAFSTGLALLILYAINEWNHSAPFVQLRVLTYHRNVWMALLILLNVLVVALAGTMLPISYLGSIWDYRPLQSASIGLVMALPQFIIGPIVAFFLYRRCLDARVIYISGLLLLLLGCYFGSHLDGEWIDRNFFLCQIILAIGLPTAIISTIYMASNNIVVTIGPALGGAINTLRCLGTLAGTAIVGQYMNMRQHYHYEWLRDKASDFSGNWTFSITDMTQILNKEAFILSTVDTYCLLGTLAACLILIVCCMRYTPPPQAPEKP
jgi:DHA2 family multidrug resistance protein